MQYRGKQFSTVEELCKALNVPVARFYYFANNVDKHVKHRSLVKKDGKSREIVAPAKHLKIIQRRIKSELLQKYTYPDYVYGLGGNTLVDHAVVHQGDKQLIKIDLCDFFPSIQHGRVYDMWVNIFSFPPELSRLLTKLITYDGKLQQGFPTSSHVAAIISESFTQRLMGHCETNGIKFSQYVDDLNFSSSTLIYKDIFKLAISAARQAGFSVKRKKTTVYPSNVGKVVTGVSIFGERTRATRSVRKKAIEALKALAEHPKDEHLLNVTAGYRIFLSHTRPQDGDKYKSLLKNVRNTNK